MSNAMRSGKRALAGFAAGALGAGLISFVAAPSSQASTAASIAFQFPSITAVGTGVLDDTAISLPILAFDSGGDLITDDIGATQRVDVVVTKPTVVTDDSIGFSIPGGTGGIGKNVSSAVQATAPQLATSTIDLIPANPAGSESWNNAVTQMNRQGTYTITASLVNTASGAVTSTSTMTLQLVQGGGAPAATVRYISGPAYDSQGDINVLDQLGTTTATTTAATSTGQADTFAVQVLDAKGGPYLILDDSVLLAQGTSTAEADLSGGWASASTQSVYAVAGALNAWGAPGLSSLTTNVRPTTSTGTASGTGSLTVEVGGVQSGATNVPNATLATTPSFEVSDDTFQVPTGTTSLSFTILTSSSLSDTTMQWNAWSNADGGAVSKSGGRVALAADAGSVSFTVNATAAAADDSLTFTVGPEGKQDEVRVVFADPVAAIDTTPGIAKVSLATTISGSITDQFGRSLPGTWAVSLKVTNSCSATSVATATASANGAFTLDVPAAQALTAAGSKQFWVCANNGLNTAGPTLSTVTYTATGGVTSLLLNTPAQISTGVTATTRPLIRVPANGTAVLTQTTQLASPTTVYDDTLVNAASQALQLTAAVSPNTNVTFSGTDGVLFTDRATGSIFYADATKTYTNATAAATVTAFAIATKPGLHTVTVTAGTSTATYNFYAQVASNAGRVMVVNPTVMPIAKNEFKSIDVTVTDIFGNAVPRNSGISAVLAGGGTLSSASLTTDSAGKASVFYTSPNGIGNALVTFTGSAANWQTGVIAGAPVAVRTGTTNITVSDGPDPELKTILIVGERATVSGKPGIRVEGQTTGFADKAKMKPWIRFPGQTEYSAGTARPTVTAIGDFEWQRKTGKKVYVYFTSEDDATRSNRVVIPAN